MGIPRDIVYFLLKIYKKIVQKACKKYDLGQIPLIFS